jgi:hypothetical protein
LEQSWFFRARWILRADRSGLFCFHAAIFRFSAFESASVTTPGDALIRHWQLRAATEACIAGLKAQGKPMDWRKCFRHPCRRDKTEFHSSRIRLQTWKAMVPDQGHSAPSSTEFILVRLGFGVNLSTAWFLQITKTCL